MATRRSFDDLVAEADAAPIRGWDFSWLDGRAFEQRPSWRYSELVAARARDASRMLDLQSGGGEMLAGLPVVPPLLIASEGYAPNLAIAGVRLHARGVFVVGAAEDHLPLRSDSFDLATSRHPVTTPWTELARVIEPGGMFLSQQVGPRSMIEMSEFFLGPQSPGSRRDPRVAVAAAEAAGLTVTDLREEQLLTTFDDVAAVIYYLRLVIWIVPNFTTSRYRERLLALHHQIERSGPFQAIATRFLIEAVKLRTTQL